MISCDYCHEEIDDDHVGLNKVEISFQINAAIYKKKFHICDDCIDLFKEFRQNTFDDIGMFL